MRILAIDTATEACSAAVLTPERMASRYAELDRAHAEQILQMVDEVLAETGVALPELDAIAFGRGPGAFTGCRLAASIAQGLAYGAGRRVVPISDLRALAQRVLDHAEPARGVLVCADARMQEVYWGYYRRDSMGLAEPWGTEQVGAPERVQLPAGVEPPVHGVGRATSSRRYAGTASCGASARPAAASGRASRATSWARGSHSPWTSVSSAARRFKTCG